MRAAGLPAPTTSAAACAACVAVAAPTPAACRLDFSDQHRVAQAFITAAIRLGPLPPAENDRPSAYRGRHRRTAACLTPTGQAARP